MLSLIKRNLLIFIIALLIALAGSLYWSNNKQSSFHTTIFTTIANQSDSSSQENEQASTYFGETLMGWFRNPAFLEKIYTAANSHGSLSAHKQERQNLIIEIDAASESTNHKLAEAALAILETEIENFNQKTENKFTLLNLGTTTYQNPIKNTLFIFASILGVLLVTLFGIIILEALQGKISLPIQVNSIFKKHTYLDLNLKQKVDFEYLATLCLKSKKTLFFAGVDFDHSDLTVQTALKASAIDKNIILIDGDLKEKKLHHSLGLSEMMKNLKGLTNRIKKEENLNQFIHKAVDGNLNFLAAGSGAEVILDDISEQLEAHKTIMIHTILPQNFPILSLEDFELFLFVRLGKSKIKTLEQINALDLKNLKIFIV